jgi:hypothetical protein
METFDPYQRLSSTPLLALAGGSCERDAPSKGSGKRCDS